VFYTVQKRIKEILEEEATGNGRLSSLSSVNLGDFVLLSEDRYPAAFVVYEGGNISGFPYKVDCELEYSIYIYTLGATVEEATEQLESLFWQEDEGQLYIPKGIIPTLMANLGRNAGGKTYRMSVGKTEVMTGKDNGGRFTSALRVPLTVTTKRTLQT